MQKSKRLIIAALFLMSGVVGSISNASVSSTNMVTGGSYDLSHIVKLSSNAVVSIVSEKKVSEKDLSELAVKKNKEIKLSSLGSGVIFDSKRGMIITNAHVVEKSEYIFVSLRDGRRLQAKLIGSDEGFDIAVLQIKADDLASLDFADSNLVNVGDFVAAIGSPFGLNGTVTSGVVSSLRRSDPKIEGYQSFIQTDAPINPGNSGGPLINSEGKVIGINTALVGPGSSVGIGFAIPSNVAKGLALQLIKYGKVERGVLGILAQPITKPLADALKLPKEQGIIVSQIINGGPADKAGIKVRDIIVSVDGSPMRDPSQIRNALAMTRPGTKITIKIIRASKHKTITVKVGDPNSSVKLPTVKFLAGLTLRDFKELEADGNTLKGVLVADVARNSQGRLAGLVPSDVITHANLSPVATIKDITAIANKSGKSLLLTVNRNNLSIFLVVSS